MKPRQRTRYKTEIERVSPPASRGTFEQQESCFLGVSLENGNFTAAKFESMALWISRRFSHCTVLVGDSIHRITLQSTRSLDPDSARQAALQLGRDFIAERRHVLDVYRPKTEFTFLPCSEVQAWGAYARYFQELRALYDRDRAFRVSVEAFGRRYHDKRSSGLSAPDLEHRIRMSAQYFLEEFAVFCCLKRQGIPVMVYPGSFSSLSEIANGEHGGAPRELCDLTVVSLHLKGR